MEIINFNKTTEEQTNLKLDEVSDYLNQNNTIFIHLIENERILFKELAKILNLPPIVVNEFSTDTSPKFIQLSNCLYIVINIFSAANEKEHPEVAFILGENYLILINKRNIKSVEDTIDQLKKEIINFQNGADYILFQVLNKITENSMNSINDWSAKLVDIEDEILKQNESSISLVLASIRKKLIYLKSISIYYLEFLQKILLKQSRFISEKNQPYFNEVFNKVTEINSLVESNNSLIINLYNLYFSLLTKKTNDVIQNLTIISTIFLPLTFIAAIYSMNFDNIPISKHPYGYFIILFIMFVITMFSLLYFRRKKWL